MNEQHNKDNQPKSNETLRALVQFSQIGITMTASVFMGVLLGKYLDGLLGTAPWLLLIFSLLGVAAAIRALFNIVKDK